MLLIDFFSKDGAPAHTAATTVAHLTTENVNFIEPRQWPPCSPELNPLDYFVWPYFLQRLHNNGRNTFDNIDELREGLTQYWEELPQNSIRAAIDSWRRRVSAVANVQGGHIQGVIMMCSRRKDLISCFHKVIFFRGSVS